MCCIVWVVSGMNLYRRLVISQRVLFTESTVRKSENLSDHSPGVVKCPILGLDITLQ